MQAYKTLNIYLSYDRMRYYLGNILWKGMVFYERSRKEFGEYRSRSYREGF